MDRSIGRALALGTAIASTLAAMPAAYAQTASATAQEAEGSGAFGDIIVTATKRGDTTVQNTPVTINAFSSDELQNKDINNLEDLSSLTAGLDINQASPGQTEVIIRGVTLGNVTSGSMQNRATTGLYVNDVSFEQNGMNPDPDLYDLERVEVLKGPQGTLFGSSAMAGAIRYVTKRPIFNEVSGQAVADVSTTRHGGESYSVKGVINVPLVDDTLAMRLMAYRNDNAGWIDNALTGRTDINFDKQTGARFSALLQATETLSAHLMVQYQKMQVGHSPSAQSGDSSIWGPGPDSPGEFTTFMKGESSWRDKFLLSTFEVNWDLGGATLTSVSGLVDRKFRNARPGDMQEFMLASYGVDLPNPVFTDPYTSRKFSQELRVAASIGEIASLTAGVYAADGHVAYTSLMREDGWDQYLADEYMIDPARMGCLPEQIDAVFCGRKRIDERQLAAFGELDVSITPELTATIGARWFDYKLTLDMHYAGFFNYGITDKTQTFRENGINPKFGLAYDAGDVLLYASAAKGFRMGGVDDPISALCQPELDELGLEGYDGVFQSDSLWTYEVGAKSSLLGNRLTLNGVAFNTEWSDIQTGVSLVCGYGITQNDTKQRIRGLEVSSRLAVTDTFGIELNASYTDARLVGDGLVGDDGDRAPNVPRYTINGTLDYEHPVTDDLTAFGLLTATHRAAYNTAYMVTSLVELPAQTVVNLRLGLRSDRYQVSLFARNLTDELILTGVGNGRGGERDWTVGRPRSFGAELQFDF